MRTNIDSLARDVMDKFEVPGLAVLSQHGGETLDALYLGADAASIPVTRDSLFIAASITKLATALAVLRLADQNEFALDDPLAKFLPDARAAQDGVTVRTLLSHMAGLPMDLPNEHELYGVVKSWDEIRDECLKVELIQPPRTRVLYGNVGYGLLARIVEKITHQKFSDALRALVLAPLNIEGYLGDETPREPMKLGDVRSEHAGTALEPYNSRYYRALGLPWSGLVTNAEGALGLVRAFAGYTSQTNAPRDTGSDPPRAFLSDALRREAVSNQTDDLPGGYGGRFDYPRAPWGLGVDLRGDKKPHWTPPNASARTFGHAGASGCVVWHNPEKNIAWAIFGTRTADNAWLVRGATRIAEKILDVSGH